MSDFSKKVTYLYEKVANKNLDMLTELFFISDKDVSFENRKKHIRKWLDGIQKPKLFVSEYEKYPFFKEITIGERRIFKDGREFLSIEFDEFKKRVQEYINFKADADSKTSITHFSYLYLFNLNSTHRFQLYRYDITYEDKISHNEYIVSIVNSENNTKYDGKVTIKSNKLILQFENKNDYATLIINLSYLSDKTDFLVGVVAGISDLNNQTPVAKKAILSKKEFKNEEEQRLAYSIINETESLFAIEHSVSSLPFETPKNSIEKAKIKLEYLNQHFKKLVEKSSFGKCYYQLAFNELIETKELFEKINNNQSFHLFNRYTILNAILDSHRFECYKKIHWVMPIYKAYFIFDDSSDNTKKIVENLEKLAKDKSVEIEILFVVIDCNKPLSITFKNYLEKLNSFAQVSFVDYDKIRKITESIDFIYTDIKNFTVFKPLKFYRELFIYENHKEKIFNYDTIFQDIKNLSTPYYKDLNPKNFCKANEYFVEELVGKWHLYIEGSIELIYYQVEIFKDNSVYVYKDGKVVDKGKIIFKLMQSIILLDDLQTNKVGVIVFDTRHHNIKEAFIAKLLYKQYGKYEDIFTLGIFSKKEIDLKDVEYIFRGKNNHDVRKLVDCSVNNRLIEYIGKI